MEEELGGADAGGAVEPLLDDVVFEKVCEGEEAHALVVGHPGAHELGLFALGVVGGLVEAVGADPLQLGHAA